jgi:tRNA(Ile)-lysidine synthase
MLQKSIAFENRVLRYIREEHMFTKPGGVVVACSGGPDSLCLLSILSHWKVKLGLQLAVAWYDHGLRPAQSENERNLVQKYSSELGLPIFSGSGNTRQHAEENKMSIEEAARNLRYLFLGDICLKLGFQTIASGHTADDHAETILLHLLRGCGIDGLAGLSPSSPLPLAKPEYRSLILARPLLILERRDTESYCAAKKMKYVRDPSNRSMLYLRNKIRHKLLPMMESINPAVRRNLLRLSKSAAEAHNSLSHNVSSLPKPTIEKDGSVVISRVEMANMTSPVRSAYLRAALQSLIPGLKDVNAYHFRSLSSLASGPGGRLLHLPAGIVASAQGEFVVIGRSPPMSAKKVDQTEIPINVPGRTHYGNWEIDAAITKPPLKRPAPDSAYFDAQAVEAGLSVGPWHKGDWIQPLGMAGRKKLQDLFTDSKIARPLRSQLPIVRCNGQVLWIPGIRQADLACVKTNTGTILRLTCRQLP